MFSYARTVFKIIALKLKLQKRHENSKLSKYSICRQNDKKKHKYQKLNDTR